MLKNLPTAEPNDSSDQEYAQYPSMICNVIFNSIHLLRIQSLAHVNSWFPPGLEIGENLEKWEGIFQSGKSQGILSRLEKLEFCPKYWKNGKI